MKKMNKDTKRPYCKYCEDYVKKTYDNNGVDLCKDCDDKYSNRTGYCSLSCCVTGHCDGTC